MRDLDAEAPIVRSTKAWLVLLMMAACCKHTPVIIMTSERTGHWKRIRRFLVRFSGPAI